MFYKQLLLKNWKTKKKKFYRIVNDYQNRGDRPILEKPIPEIIENGKVRVIVEKNKKLANM